MHRTTRERERERERGPADVFAPEIPFHNEIIKSIRYISAQIRQHQRILFREYFSVYIFEYLPFTCNNAKTTNLLLDDKL